MSDPADAARRERAEEWMRERFRETFDGNRGSMIPTALTAHEAGQELGEQRAAAEIAKLRKLVRWRNDNTRATVLSMPDDMVGAFMRALKEQP